MKNPIISICIPAYKRIDYLKRLLCSIEIQKFKDYEVIISDDSNDHSVAALLKEFNGRFEIKYFKNEKALEDYISNAGKLDKKVKKGCCAKK